jgi:NAD-reducing hydrogenase large subunit
MTTRIVIDPVTRIEGHAKISIFLDATGRVTHAQFHVTEFRAFEAFCVGRAFGELPGITSRICGICPVSHMLASAKAGDALLGMPIPPTAVLVRRLINLAQLVQSHALSFFYLNAPDLVLGMDSDPARRNIFGLIAAEPALAHNGIRLRQFGQTIIEALGGRRIHPTCAVPGGVRASLDVDGRAAIRAALPEMLTIARDALDRLQALFDLHATEVRVFGDFPSMFLALVGPDGTWEHYDGRLRLIDHTGAALVEDLNPDEYRTILGEAIEPWSYMKFAYYVPHGYPAGMYRVGPLARLNVCRQMGTPEADAALQALRERAGATLTGSFFAHAARLIEVIAALERIAQIIDDPLLDDPCVRNDATSVLHPRGVGVSEAPRGTLFHDYSVDKSGQITQVNLLIATGQNNLALNQTITQIAQHYIQGTTIPEGMLNRVEAGVRAYDPCLSCATHTAGRMPLLVQLHAADGTMLDEVRR